MSDDNEKNHNAHMGQSAQYNEEAKALARAAEANRQGTSQTRPLPPPSNVIPDSALPPGLTAAEKQAYIDQMIGRSSGSSPRDYVSSKDYGSLPPVDLANLKPLSKGGMSKSLSQLQPGGTIQYAGTRVEVELAVSLGILKRSPTGGYEAPSAAENAAREEVERKAQEQQQEAEKADVQTRIADGESPDLATMEVALTVTDAVAPEVYSHIARDAVLNGGQLSLANVTEAAQRAGMSAEQGQEAATALYTGYRRQAEKAAKSVGVSQEDMNNAWTWMEERYKSEHAQAVLSLVHGGGVRGLKDLARKYLAYRRGNR